MTHLLTRLGPRCQYFSMSLRAKERFIEETSGFRIGESPEQFQQRLKEIAALTKKLISGKLTFREVERTQERLYTLKGLPPDESDYEPHDDD
jgi:hypothetical protein